jgi:hypothetical protein
MLHPFQSLPLTLDDPGEEGQMAGVGETVFHSRDFAEKVKFQDSLGNAK